MFTRTTLAICTLSLTLLACGGPKPTPDETPVETSVDASTLPEEAPKTILTYAYATPCADAMTNIKAAVEGMGQSIASQEAAAMMTGTMTSETAPTEYTYKLAFTDKGDKCGVIATKMFKDESGAARSMRDTNFEWKLLKAIDANAAAALVK